MNFPRVILSSIAYHLSICSECTLYGQHYSPRLWKSQQNRAGLSVKPPIYALFHIFFILSLPYPHPQNSTKNRPAKKQGVTGAGQRGRTSISFQEEKYSGNWNKPAKNMKSLLIVRTFWSGLRGSNSLPPPWQGGALPDELNPHTVQINNVRENQTWCLRTESNHRHEDFQSSALPTELQKQNNGDRNGARTHDL